MRMYDIIEKKRDGRKLSYEEIKFFIKGYCEGEIPDYQAAALLMAIFLKKMNAEETIDLTEIMADSGKKIDLTAIKGVKVDKHSTGGVGDKTTLVVGPTVAACGVPVAKMAGRGLGHTGGTIDKLESIPGFRTKLSINEFIKNINTVGISIASQTGNLVPADKKLYSLRNATATTNNISLIASSIMSKKIAAGADRIVLDVKCGKGAFIKTIEESKELAGILVDIGNRVGKKTTAIITNMDEPLGRAVGNSLEVIEAIETLKGHGPKDLEEISIEISAKMLELALGNNMAACREKAKEAIENGKALAKFSEMVEMQGGNPDIIKNYNTFKKPDITYDFVSVNEGYIESIKTDLLGNAAVLLGSGRETPEGHIDYSAGILLYKKIGMHVKKGGTIARLFTDDSNKLSNAIKMMDGSFSFSSSFPTPKPLILAYME